MLNIALVPKLWIICYMFAHFYIFLIMLFPEFSLCCSVTKIEPQTTVWEPVQMWFLLCTTTWMNECYCDYPKLWMRCVFVRRRAQTSLKPMCRHSRKFTVGGGWVWEFAKKNCHERTWTLLLCNNLWDLGIVLRFMKRLYILETILSFVCWNKEYFIWRRPFAFLHFYTQILYRAFLHST